MSASRLNLSEFSTLSPAEQATCVEGLLASRSEPLNGHLVELDDKIGGFEARYEMSSAEMSRRLSAGTLSETADICSWRILLELRDRVRQRAE